MVYRDITLLFLTLRDNVILTLFGTLILTNHHQAHCEGKRWPLSHPVAPRNHKVGLTESNRSFEQTERCCAASRDAEFAVIDGQRTRVKDAVSHV